MELLIILLLIFLNGIFAMSELAIVSARKVRLHQWASEGNARARAALELAEHPNRFLSTTQIGITLVGIFAGAFGGATIAEKLAAWLKGLPLLAPYSEPLALGLVVLGITYLSLIVGELVPKRLALQSPERIASLVAAPMRFLSVIAHPAVRVLSVSTDLVLRALGMRPSTEPPITEEEIQVLLQQGTQAGVFEEAEREMVAGVFRLGERRVSALMTPRTEIVWLNLEDPPQETHHRITDSALSQFPVCRGDLDQLLGIVQARDLLARMLEGQPLDLEAVLQAPLFVHEGVSAVRQAPGAGDRRIWSPPGTGDDDGYPGGDRRRHRAGGAARRPTRRWLVAAGRDADDRRVYGDPTTRQAARRGGRSLSHPGRIRDDARPARPGRGRPFHLGRPSLRGHGYGR
jgi:putative hemolysin